MSSTLDITSFGASPESSDNTNAIQMALNDAGLQGDTVLVPPGVFLVDPVRSLLVRSRTTLQIDGTLKALPGALDRPNAIVNLNGVHDVMICGSGFMVGERYAHAPGNRAGFCIAMTGSINITVGSTIASTRVLRLSDAWADGIYVQDCRNVTVNGVECSNNARNGMSIISAEGMVVSHSVFTLTHSESPMPQAGIDIEPDLPTQSLLDIKITGNRFSMNKGAGVYSAFAAGPNRTRINVTGNTFDQHYKDGSGPCIGGRNTALANLCYATLRWVPGYDYWYFPTEFTA